MRTCIIMTTKRSAFPIAALLSLVGTCGALAEQSPTPPCRAGGQHFTSIESLPRPVMLTILHHFAPDEPIAQLVAAKPPLVAKRDADWQVTDAHSDRDLPDRRFILGAQAGDQLLVWYETGGIAHMYHLAVFAQAGQGWRQSRHLADGSLAALCRRLGTRDNSVNDQSW